MSGSYDGGDSLDALTGGKTPKGKPVVVPLSGSASESRLSRAGSQASRGSGVGGAGGASGGGSARSLGSGDGVGTPPLSATRRPPDDSLSATAEWRKTLSLRFNFSEFLRDLGLSDYEDLLRETGFDDHESLLAIEEDDMDAIGMITGHKRKLLRAVAELSERLQEEGLLAGDSRFARTGASAGAGRPTRRASLEMRRDSAAPGSTDGDGSDGGDGGGDDASAKKRKPKEKRRRRRRADEMPPKPLTLEEKAAAGVVGTSEVVLETVFPGDDLNFPQDGEIARVHYTCKLVDGTLIEDSRSRGRPFQFKVGVSQVVKGMDIAIKQMSRGQRAKVVIPGSLAYGEAGAFPLIPPNASMIFELQLIDFNDAAVLLTARDTYDPEIDGSPRDP